MKKNALDIKQIEDIANRIRINVVKMIAKSGIGHVGGSMSIVEIISTLYFHELNIDKLDCEDRDRFILSKGHGCPAFMRPFQNSALLPKSHLPRCMRLTVHFRCIQNMAAALVLK